MGIEDAQDLILDLEQAIKVRLKYAEIKEAAGQHGGRSMENISLIFQW